MPISEPTSGRRTRLPIEGIEESRGRRRSRCRGGLVMGLGCHRSVPGLVNNGVPGAAFRRGGADRRCPALGYILGPDTRRWALAGAGRCASQRRVDIGCVDDPRSGQHRFGREVESIIDEAVQQRHGKIALQVRLLIDREQLRAGLDTLEPVSSMSNEASLTLSPTLAWLMALAALLASGALMVMTPSTVVSFSRAALIASATAVGLPKLDDGNGSWLDLPPPCRWRRRCPCSGLPCSWPPAAC